MLLSCCKSSACDDQKYLTRLPRSVLIENDNTGTGVYVCASGESVENNVTGWEPRPAIVVQAANKFLPGKLRGLQKLGLKNSDETCTNESRGLEFVHLPFANRKDHSMPD